MLARRHAEVSVATILIVDDRPINREHLLAFLGGRGHRMLQATDGAEALATARVEHPDLVLADILMPTMDGYELVRQLRAEAAIAGTPVIFFTAYYHEPEARTLANACGVSHVLSKPCEPEVILRTVEAALGAAPPDSVLARPPEEFEREHLRLVTDKLSQKADELRRTNERLTALVNLGLQLGSERDPPRLLQSFCHAARELTLARYAVVGILNEGGGLRYFVTSGMDAETAARLGAANPRQGEPGIVLGQMRCRRLHNPGGDPAAVGFSGSGPPILSWLGAPIVSPERVHGWLGLIDKIGAPAFSEEDERLAGALALQVGRIYQNGSLYTDLLRRSSDLDLEIAEHKKTEESLRQSEMRFRSVVEGSLQGILVWSAERIEYANPTCASMFGYDSPKEIISQPWYCLVAPEEVPSHQARAEACLRGESLPAHPGWQGIRKDGSRLWLESTARPFTWEGQPALLAFVMDITERKRAEEALAERVRLASLFGEIGLALTQGKTLQEILRMCARGLVEYLDAALVRIWTLNDAQGVLDLQASAGLDTRLNGVRSRIPVGALETGLIAQERTPHWTNEVFTDPRLGDEEWARREGIVAFAGHPLLVEDRLVGVVGMFARAAFSEATLHAIASVAHQIALGIERKRAEEALREREEHIRLLLDSTAEAIFGVDLEGNCTFANPACARMLGYTQPGQFLGKNMHTLSHHSRPDGTPYPAQECPIHQTLQHGEGARVDDEVLWRADGTSFPAEYSSYPVRRGGELVGAVGTFVDISERLRVEKQLQHILAASPSAIYSLRVEGKALVPLWWSETISRLLGYTVAESLEPDLWDLAVHPQDREQAQASKADLFGQGYCVSEYRFRHKDGSYRWIRDEKRLLRDKAGRPAEVVGSWNDITDRKALEEQYRQAQKMEAVGRLAGGVAHDFNNLLTVINGYGQLLLERLPADDPSRELIREMVGAGGRAASLTRQLLAFSRKTILEPKVLDLKTVVADVEKMLHRIIGEDIQLTTVADPELGAVKADPSHIEQLLLNLVINARDAMPTGGQLTIEVANVELDESYVREHAEAQRGPHVLLAVTDTGCGMDATTAAQIWEPFFTTKGEKGTGLGLATVYGIVKQSGGHTAVYSEVGHGTTFKVYLPRIPERPRSSVSHHGMPEMPRGSETVLLVEDEEGVRALARHVLAGCGYTVLEAHDGGEAVRIAGGHTGRIDLLVTDVVMPRMGGREVAARLATLQPGIKILFLSGYTDDAVVRHGILEAEVAFLHKPFSITSLAGKVREVLDSR
jgi:PAS domain S-box-containing protein